MAHPRRGSRVTPFLASEQFYSRKKCSTRRLQRTLWKKSALREKEKLSHWKAVSSWGGGGGPLAKRLEKREGKERRMACTLSID